MSAIHKSHETFKKKSCYVNADTDPFNELTILSFDDELLTNIGGTEFNLLSLSKAW